MIKQIPIAKVTLLIDKTYSLLQLSTQLSAYGEQAKLLFIEPQTGAGFFQWTLPGEGWKAFGDLDEQTKRIIAPIYLQRQDMLRNTLGDFPLRDAVLKVPSEDEFVFFRQKDGDWEIALTAWGYQFVSMPPAGGISAWYEQKEYQEVNVGFQWDGALQPNLPFVINGQPRTTSEDGLFHVDEPLEINSRFEVKSVNGREFMLVVEKGKAEYVYDITQYLTVEVGATKDGMALVSEPCTVNFNGSDYHIDTDGTGTGSIVMPLSFQRVGNALAPQPECAVTCSGETQRKTPTDDGKTLRFDFKFKTPVDDSEVVEEQKSPVIGPETPESETKYVKIRLLDYGGYPLSDLPFKLTTKKMGEKELKTDEKGYCQVPQEWFSSKEKMQIKFVVSPEYQETHDLHLKK